MIPVLMRKSFIVALCFSVWITHGLAASRVAFVIGNQDYTETGRFSDLGTTRHDAREVARLLREDAGFDRVQTLLDKTRREMEQDLAAFAQTILPGDEVVFYFAGHGVEYDNKLYLMGTDAEFLLKAKLDQEGMSEPVVSATLAGTGAKISVLLLDCCRQVPDQTWLASETATRGLRGEQAALPKPPPNVLVGYATSAGRLANDNLAESDQNGPLVASLKRHWSSGLEFDALWKQVARDVYAASLAVVEKEKNPNVEIQMPSKYGQTIHDFYFVRNGSAAPLRPAPPERMIQPVPTAPEPLPTKPKVLAQAMKGAIKAELMSLTLHGPTEATAEIRLTNTSTSQALKIGVDWQEPNAMGYNPNPPLGSRLQTSAGARLVCLFVSGVKPEPYLNTLPSGGVIDHHESAIESATDLAPGDSVTVQLEYGLVKIAGGFQIVGQGSADLGQAPRSDRPATSAAINLHLWQVSVQGSKWSRSTRHLFEFTDIPVKPLF